MSIQHLDPEGRPSTTKGTLRAVLRTETTSWPSAIAEVEASLDAAGELEETLTPAEYGALLRRLDRVQRRLDGMRLALISSAQRRGLARAQGFADTGSWVADATTSAHRTARADVRLADTLTRRLPATAEALTAGELSREHAAVIEHVTRTLPRGLSTAHWNASRPISFSRLPPSTR